MNQWQTQAIWGPGGLIYKPPPPLTITPNCGSSIIIYGKIGKLRKRSGAPVKYGF